MAKIHNSAMGRPIDMAAMRIKHEKTRAVGNMSVNAHGDVIDSNNNIVTDNAKRVNAMYQKTMDAAARGKAKMEQQVVQEQPISAASSKKTTGKSKKSPELELTQEEVNHLDEFNEPNPKK